MAEPEMLAGLLSCAHRLNLGASEDRLLNPCTLSPNVLSILSVIPSGFHPNVVFFVPIKLYLPTQLVGFGQWAVV